MSKSAKKMEARKRKNHEKSVEAKKIAAKIRKLWRLTK